MDTLTVVIVIAVVLVVLAVAALLFTKSRRGRQARQIEKAEQIRRQAIEDAAALQGREADIAETSAAAKRAQADAAAKSAEADRLLAEANQGQAQAASSRAKVNEQFERAAKLDPRTADTEKRTSAPQNANGPGQPAPQQQGSVRPQDGQNRVTPPPGYQPRNGGAHSTDRNANPNEVGANGRNYQGPPADQQYSDPRTQPPTRR